MSNYTHQYSRYSVALTTLLEDPSIKPSSLADNSYRTFVDSVVSACIRAVSIDLPGASRSVNMNLYNRDVHDEVTAIKEAADEWMKCQQPKAQLTTPEELLRGWTLWFTGWTSQVGEQNMPRLMAFCLRTGKVNEAAVATWTESWKALYKEAIVLCAVESNRIETCR